MPNDVLLSTQGLKRNRDPPSACLPPIGGT